MSSWVAAQPIRCVFLACSVDRFWVGCAPWSARRSIPNLKRSELVWQRWSVQMYSCLVDRSLALPHIHLSPKMQHTPENYGRKPISPPPPPHRPYKRAVLGRCTVWENWWLVYHLDLDSLDVHIKTILLRSRLHTSRKFIRPFILASRRKHMSVVVHVSITSRRRKDSKHIVHQAVGCNISTFLCTKNEHIPCHEVLQPWPDYSSSQVFTKDGCSLEIRVYEWIFSSQHWGRWPPPYQTALIFAIYYLTTHHPVWA